MINIKKEFNWKTLPELFFEKAKKQLDKPLLWYKINNQYKSYSWKIVRKKILLLSSKLIQLGIKKGDKIIIISENNPNWFITDFAIMLAGGITVPAYTTYTKKDYEYLIKDTQAKMVFVSNKKLFLNFLPAIKNNKQIKNIFSYKKINHGVNENIIFLEDVWKDKIKKKYVKIKITEDDPACIIYTSGTSGVPKGVILTHKSIRSNLIGSLDIFKNTNFNDERYISFLPLSHSYEHTAGQFMPLLTSSEIFYAENMDKLFANFKEVNPTYIAAVPRFYEAIYKKILNNFSKNKILERIFNTNLNLGKKIYLNQKRFLLMTRFLKFFFKIIFDNKIKKIFGNNLKFLISGGGALSYEINIFFEAIGIKILQGYGLTETSPTVSCNRPELNKIGTVGPPIKGVKAKIANDGEILIKSESLMKGYLGKEKETKDKIKNNWLHTGDIGKFDKDNYLIITDRKKDIIVTSGGDNIAPQKIENMFISTDSISQVLIFGDNKPFLIALIFVNNDYSKKDGINNEIDRHLRKINEKLSSVEKIRKYVLINQELTQKNGFLTPTMKVKRRKVYKKYKKDIEGLYN